MTAVAVRKLSQSNPELAVSHFNLQRSLEGLGSGAVSNKMLDGSSSISFGEELSLSNQRSKIVYMDKISALELQLSSLVNAVSERAAELNNRGPRNLGIGGIQSAANKESLPKCEEVGNCWSWIMQLARLSQIHITYAAEYHKFFFEARDIDSSLEQEKARIFSDLSTGDRRSLGSLPFECRRLSSCMRSHLSRLVLLGQRAQELAGRSGSVQPVHLRLPPAKHQADGAASSLSRHRRRAVALCSFVSPADGLRVQMDEEVTVVDIADRNVWRVEKAAGGGQLDLPSVCLALLGPDPEAMETMARLRDTIVAVWMQVLTSYKHHVGDLLRSFLEFIQMERYSVEPDSAAEASLFALMSELESGYLCYLNELDSAAFAGLLAQIRARRSPPSEQAVRASRERRLSNVSLSSVASTDGGGGGLSRSDSQRGSRRTRSLKESEVIQPRALLKVLNEHVEALERLRSRKLDGQDPMLTGQDEAVRSPAISVPAIHIQADERETSNVHVFSNQTDAEKLTNRPQPYHNQQQQQQQIQQRRSRNISTASSRTVTSTVANEEVHRLLTVGVGGAASTTDGGPSLVRSSSAMGEPLPGASEPERHVSRMYWMVNQPTRVEREIHRAEVLVGRQLAVDLPHRNFVSAKRLQLGDDNDGGDGGGRVFAVTKVECSFPLRLPVVDAGAELDVRQESRTAQTLGDFKEVRATATLALQTPPPPEASDCGASVDFASAEAGVRAADKPPARSVASVQTLGDFKEVRPTAGLAVQTQPADVSTSGVFVDFASADAGVHAAEKPPARSDVSAQTLGDFKEVRPTVGLAVQTQPADVSTCGVFVDFASLEAGVRATEKPPAKSDVSAQTLGDFKEVQPANSLAVQTQPADVSTCGVFVDFASLEAGVRAAEKPPQTSALSTQTPPPVELRVSGCSAAPRPQANSAVGVRPPAGRSVGVHAVETPTPTAHRQAQTSPTPVAETAAFRAAAPAVDAHAVAAVATVLGSASRLVASAETAVRAVPPAAPAATPTAHRQAQTSPTPVADCGAQQTVELKSASVRCSEPRPASALGFAVAAAARPMMRAVGVVCQPEVSASLARCRGGVAAAAEAATQANFQLELVGRLLVRNHNLEEARILSLRRTVCDQEELNSAGQRRVTDEAGLRFVEWDELSSRHHLGDDGPSEGGQ